MKLTNYLATFNNAKRNLQALCLAKGYQLDWIELCEESTIKFLDQHHIKISYSTESYEVYTIARIEGDRLVFIETEFNEGAIITNKGATTGVAK